MYSTHVLHMLNKFLTYVKHVFNKTYVFAFICCIYILYRRYMAEIVFRYRVKHYQINQYIYLTHVFNRCVKHIKNTHVKNMCIFTYI